MVFHNTVYMKASDPNYENETFRARNGFKEQHAHDAPFRRSRDFIPVTYGAYVGIPNYKHSEPYSLLKNIKDLVNEEHNHGIKYGKLALKGGILGAVFGQLYFVGGPVGAFEMSKLMAASGNRPFSGRGFR